MDDAARVVVERHLEVALGMRLDLDRVADEANLDALGLDSLSVISVVVSLSEECGADLMEHVELLLSPRCVGDLLAITATLLASGRGADVGSPLPVTT